MARWFGCYRNQPPLTQAHNHLHLEKWKSCQGMTHPEWSHVTAKKRKSTEFKWLYFYNPWLFIATKQRPNFLTFTSFRKCPRFNIENRLISTFSFYVFVVLLECRTKLPADKMPVIKNHVYNITQTIKYAIIVLLLIKLHFQYQAAVSD